MTRTFTSYVSEYDAHRGTRRMNDLSREDQNNLITLMFQPEGDTHAYVMEHDIDHKQPDGLWTIIVALGTLLERKSVIKEFPSAATEDHDLIINMLAGTRLCLRLEEAFEPFDRAIPLTDYEWAEIEIFGARDAIVGLTDNDAAIQIKRLLAPVARDPDGIERRMPYQDFVKQWNQGHLALYVDRGLAVQAYRLADSAWTYLPLAFFAGLMAFIPVMIFVGFWWGVAVLVLTIFARKLLTKKADTWVRTTALKDRARYRWFTSRGIVWARTR